ncbi:MAG: alpha/beta fold hydrolase [Actinomycetota bacterium]
MARSRDIRQAAGNAASDLGARLLAGALGAGAALGGLAWWAGRKSAEVERANPPMGSFIEVSGTRLHYLARGRGRPVVFLHGIAGMIQDWQLAMLDRAAEQWRCLAFDVPGYGWSARPGFVKWTPERLADTLRRATRRLGLERPVVVGHSFGALIALAWALEAPSELAGLVLEAGPYYPQRRLDIRMMASLGAPGMAETVSPVMVRAMLPLLLKRMFAPLPVPPRFHLFPAEMISRPVTVHAMADDFGQLSEAARRLAARYGDIAVPTVILAGDADAVIDAAGLAGRLHDAIGHSALRIEPGVGHMLHHASPATVVAAIELAWHQSDQGLSARA